MDLFDYSEKIADVANGLRGASWILISMSHPEDADETAAANFMSDGLDRYADVLEEISTGLSDIYRGSVGNVGVMALPVWHEEAVLDPELLPLSYADSIPSASSRLASIALRAVSLSSASLSGVGGRDGLLSFESSAILSSEK